MTRWQLAFKGLLWHRRSYFAVTACIATTCAVICGALLVGGSVKESLRAKAMEKLGRTESALLSGKFFREALAGELDTNFPVVPMILLQGSVRHAKNSKLATRVNIIGFDSRFNAVHPEGALEEVGFREARINEALAGEIEAAVGHELLVSFELLSDIPREHALGKRESVAGRIRLEVSSIENNSHAGIFDLKLQQESPRNIFVSLQRLQKALGRKGEINSLVACRENGAAPILADLERSLKKSVKPGDLGVKLRVDPLHGYLSLESRDFLLDSRLVKAAEKSLAENGYLHQEVLTYLANSIGLAGTEREIPYSLVTAVSPWLQPGGGISRYPLGLVENGLEVWRPGNIVLNAWAAKDLEAREGDRIRLKYFSMDSGHEVVERSVELTLKGVLDLSGGALDPGWTPEYPGVSDAETFADWDPPFPIDYSKIREPGPDGDYWKKYKTTPKGFISIEEGKGLWAGKYGQLTSIRLRKDGSQLAQDSVAEYTQHLLAAIEPAEFGLSFRPLRSDAMEASRMGTDFGQLFVGMSFFIIVAALMLTCMTLRLCLEKRVQALGIMAAIGFTARDARGVLCRELALVAVLGISLGSYGGIRYADGLIYGLRTWWKDAVNAPFLALHVSFETVFISSAATLTLAGLTGFFVIRRLILLSPRRLLSGESTPQLNRDQNPGKGRRVLLPGIMMLAGAGIALLATSTSALSAFTGFLLAGSLLLAGGLALFSAFLKSSSPLSSNARGGAALVMLGIRNGKRAGTRSLLTAGLISCATFVVVTVAAFQRDPAGEEPDLASGDGGFALVGTSSAPLYSNLQTPGGREELALDESVGALLSAPGTGIYALRERPGDETSCLNLYRPSEPRILGAPPEFTDRGGFSWAGSLASSSEEQENPWKILKRQDWPDGVVPAIGDQNTVLWILQSGLGKDLSIRNGAGHDTKLRIVGLLSNSLLQGALVVDAAAFEDLFPARRGWSSFFIEAPEENRELIREGLEKGLQDFGFDLRSSGEVLRQFNKVQNTYLSTFMILGGLGLLIGTIGLAAVLLRNVNERRGELALMRALGFSRKAVAGMVIAETLFLLVLGELQGAFAAIVATAPTLLSTQSEMHWGGLCAILLLVLLAGFASCLLALNSALKVPVLGALRSE